MTRTEKIVGTAALVVAIVVLILASMRSYSLDPNVQKLLSNSVAPAMNAISGSMSEHPAEMIPP